MKRFIFRQNIEGFYDWLKTIYQFKEIVEFNCFGGSKEWRESHQEEYEEARSWLTLYRNYIKGLTSLEKRYINRYLNDEDSDEFRQVDVKNLIDRWLTTVANQPLNCLKEISKNEVGLAISSARKEAGYSRRVMVSLLNVNPETLKAYEQGTRTLPLDVYYKIIQLLELDLM